LYFQAEGGKRGFCLSRGLGDVYNRQTHLLQNTILILQHLSLKYTNSTHK